MRGFAPGLAAPSSQSIHGSSTDVPADQLAHMSTETRLLEKRRQALEAQELLEQRKAEYARQELLFKEREDALRAKDLELQSSLTKFSRFLQDADARRERAIRKATEEHRAAVAAEAQCVQAQARLEALEHQQRTAQALLTTRMQYVPLGCVSLVLSDGCVLGGHWYTGPCVQVPTLPRVGGRRPAAGWAAGGAP